MRNNRTAFERIKLKPRVLVDVSGRSQEITLFGNKQKMPVIDRADRHGRADVVRGRDRARARRRRRRHAVTLAAGLDDGDGKSRRAEAGGTLWFQLYMWPDRKLSHQLVERAKDCRLRGAGRHRGHGVAPGPRIQSAQRLHHPVPLHPPQRHRRADASALAVRRAGALHAHHRHAALHELSGGNADQRRRAADGALDRAERLHQLGRRARAAQDVAAQADRQGHPACRRTR